jgi:hypothetical protein
MPPGIGIALNASATTATSASETRAATRLDPIDRRSSRAADGRNAFR